MVRENVKELVDFVKSESPYRSANRGWLTNDIYLQVGRSNNKSQNKFDQILGLSLFWGPINKLIYIIFIVFIATIIFVFSTISISRGNFKIPSITGKEFVSNSNIISHEKDRFDQLNETANDSQTEQIQENKIQLDSTLIDKNSEEQIKNIDETGKKKNNSLSIKAKSNLF